MVDTLFNAMSSKVFPMTLNDSAVSQILRTEIPYLNKTFGSQLKSVSLVLNQNTGDFVKLDTKRGVVLGENGKRSAKI